MTGTSEEWSWWVCFVFTTRTSVISGSPLALPRDGKLRVVRETLRAPPQLAAVLEERVGLPEISLVDISSPSFPKTEVRPTPFQLGS